jgi:hypothetical protein
MVKVNITGQIRKCTKGNGKKTSFMELEGMNGQMANNIKVISKITTKKVKDCFYGQMEKVMKEVGKTINNMEKRDSQIKKGKAK